MQQISSDNFIKLRSKLALEYSMALTKINNLYDVQIFETKEDSYQLFAAENFHTKSEHSTVTNDNSSSEVWPAVKPPIAILKRGGH